VKWVVHPQSVVHSLGRYVAARSYPIGLIRICAAHCPRAAWPEAYGFGCQCALDLLATGRLDFRAPDLEVSLPQSGTSGRPKREACLCPAQMRPNGGRRSRFSDRTHWFYVFPVIIEATTERMKPLSLSKTWNHIHGCRCSGLASTPTCSPTALNSG